MSTPNKVRHPAQKRPISNAHPSENRDNVIDRIVGCLSDGHSLTRHAHRAATRVAGSLADREITVPDPVWLVAPVTLMNDATLATVHAQVVPVFIDSVAVAPEPARKKLVVETE